MKYIKQISTGKIVYREKPHTDKTLDNAVTEHDIDKADLEVIEKNWTEDEWNSAIHNQLGYADKRKAEFPSIEECVHAILDGELDALQAKRKIVKERHPKGGN